MLTIAFPLRTGYMYVSSLYTGPQVNPPSIAEALTNANTGGSTVASIGVQVDSKDGSNITAALAAVASADAVVLVLGMTRGQEHEGMDRSDTNLPGLQESFALQVIAAAQKVHAPVILVLCNGGILSVDALIPGSDVRCLRLPPPPHHHHHHTHAPLPHTSHRPNLANKPRHHCRIRSFTMVELPKLLCTPPKVHNGVGVSTLTLHQMHIDVVTTLQAIIEAFNPVDHGTKALAESIFGGANRWGKLPVTIYNGNYTAELQGVRFISQLLAYFPNKEMRSTIDSCGRLNPQGD
jgi:hypothetical protein